MTKPMIVGVAGGTGSGKTTLAKHIADAFGQNVTVIAHDSYYHLQVGKTYEERCLINYDHPGTSTLSPLQSASRCAQSRSVSNASGWS